MTCCYDNSHDTDYTFQTSDNKIHSHYNDEVVNNQENGKTYKPLPSHCTDFFAENLCGILELPTHPKRILEDFVPLPELVLFIQKVTTKARIDVRTTIIALILVLRFKNKIQKKVPKNKIKNENGSHKIHGEYSNYKLLGEYGTCHKIFLSSIIVASKYPTGTYHPYESSSPSLSEEDLPKSSCASPINEQENLPESNNSSMFSTTPSSISSTVSSNASIEDYEFNNHQFNNHLNNHQFNNNEHSLDLINQKIAASSGIFSINEINKAERCFLKVLGKFRLSDKNVEDFIQNNRQALGIS